VYLIAFPVHAFQVSSSSTGYVRSPPLQRSGPIRRHNGPRLRVQWPRPSRHDGASVAVRIATALSGGGCSECRRPHVGGHVLFRARRAGGQNGRLAAAPPVGTRSDGSGTTLPSGAVWNPASCVHPCAFNAQQFFYVTQWRILDQLLPGQWGGTFTDPAGRGGRAATRRFQVPRAGETGLTRTMGPRHRVNRRSGLSLPQV